MFDIAELVKIAVEDERTGVSFYSALAERTANPELKKVWAELAQQERQHQRRFEEMLKSLGEAKVPEGYGGEYASYLRALTSNRAFPDEASAVRMAQESQGDAAAVDLALRFERDTLILMQEMRALVPEKDRAVVDELADEERAHIVTLTEARSRLGS
ncbi:MAG: hypothetical protein B1H04_04025 [Planctomycetales bacterium 4484_123]|nr:MAG: hypothetical protein B1H04_04025 [Planctomycetales bacterium 4484_123]